MLSVPLSHCCCYHLCSFRSLGSQKAANCMAYIAAVTTAVALTAVLPRCLPPTVAHLLPPLLPFLPVHCELCCCLLCCAAASCALLPLPSSQPIHITAPTSSATTTELPTTPLVALRCFLNTLLYSLQVSFDSPAISLHHPAPALPLCSSCCCCCCSAAAAAAGGSLTLPSLSKSQ